MTTGRITALVLALLTATEGSAQVMPGLLTLQAESLRCYTDTLRSPVPLGNPAALARQPFLALAVTGEQRFGMGALSFYQVSAAFPTPAGGVGLRLAHQGGPYFRATALTAGLGRSIGSRADLGIAVCVAGAGAAGYETERRALAEAGLRLRLSASVQVGVHLANLSASTFRRHLANPFPEELSLGLGYSPSSSFYASLALLHAAARGSTVRALVLCRFASGLEAGGGLDSGSGQYTLLAGWRLSRLSLQGLMVVHPQLGFTPGIQVLFTPQS
jgi:hypothetical protein